MKRTRNLRKFLLTMCCALLIVTLSVGITMAYLIDTEEVINTFTVGDVQIDLNETDVDEDNDTKKNDYHLIPGQTYVKDPTVTIKANSEPSYVRMLVTVEDYMDLDRICTTASFQNISSEYIYRYTDGQYVVLEKFTTGVSAEWECVMLRLIEAPVSPSMNSAIMAPRRSKRRIKLWSLCLKKFRFPAG